MDTVPDPEVMQREREERARRIDIIQAVILPKCFALLPAMIKRAHQHNYEPKLEFTARGLYQNVPFTSVEWGNCFPYSSSMFGPSTEQREENISSVVSNQRLADYLSENLKKVSPRYTVSISVDRGCHLVYCRLVALSKPFSSIRFFNKIVLLTVGSPPPPLFVK